MQLHRGGMGEEIGAPFTHLFGNDVWIANILRRSAKFEGNKRIESGTKPRDKTSPFRLVNQRPGRRAAKPGNLFNITEIERAFAPLVELYPEFGRLGPRVFELYFMLMLFLFGERIKNIISHYGHIAFMRCSPIGNIS